MKIWLKMPSCTPLMRFFCMAEPYYRFIFVRVFFSKVNYKMNATDYVRLTDTVW